MSAVRDPIERAYSEGLAAGMEIAVRLFLGEAVHNAEPCPGELDEDQERWARDALARLTEGGIV